MAKEEINPIDKYVVDAKEAFGNVCGAIGAVVGITTALYVAGIFIDILKPLDEETRSGLFTLSIIAGIVTGKASSYIAKNIGDIAINVKAAKLAAEAQKPQQPSPS